MLAYLVLGGVVLVRQIEDRPGRDLRVSHVPEGLAYILNVDRV